MGPSGQSEDTCERALRPAHAGVTHRVAQLLQALILNREGENLARM
jgi:hypothetical protein